jgi:uncharacterized membrane protein
MESRVKLFGHPLHQMLIVFPLGLLGTSVVFDIVHLWNGSPGAAWFAHALIACGVVAGLIAAPWGTIDWLAIPGGTRAKRIGALHGAGNVVVLLLFAISWWMREQEMTPVLAVAFSFTGAALALVTAWLGGELVDRLGVGVSAGAHLDAPSSLRRSTRAPDTPHRAP